MEAERRKREEREEKRRKQSRERGERGKREKRKRGMREGGSREEQYPAAGGAIPAAPNPGYPVNFDTLNPTVAGANAAAAAAGAIPAAPPNPGYPGYPVNSDTLNPAAGGANGAAPNPGYPVNCDTPFGNLSFSLSGWERVVFMIFVALCILVAVAYMIKKLVEDGEGKK
ncbi:hypothetical protein M0R45_032069 [Rubus argutus]|uniref:Uncharacterized protein n=1 Tax=Rubus argutus TaxID=59490 RepID=A0AAW1WG60_RUBAR